MHNSESSSKREEASLTVKDSYLRVKTKHHEYVLKIFFVILESADQLGLFLLNNYNTIA